MSVTSNVESIEKLFCLEARRKKGNANKKRTT